jgi:hypothetical protein
MEFEKLEPDAGVRFVVTGFFCKLDEAVWKQGCFGLLVGGNIDIFGSISCSIGLLEGIGRQQGTEANDGSYLMMRRVGSGGASLSLQGQGWIGRYMDVLLY